jgi:hypothetical protein
MKKMLFGFGSLLLFGAASCQQEASVQSVMENEAQRKEVYTMIMENPEMHQEMVQSMRTHNMGDNGMMGKDHKMMGDSTHHMMEGKNKHMMMQKMMDDCAKDSANCTMMSKMMMEHKPMMMQMMQQMRQKGMMDEACMQKMMQQMKQK